MKIIVLMLTLSKWLKSEFDLKAKEMMRKVNKTYYCW